MVRLTSGFPTPSGAHFDGTGINFTLFSANAEQVELCLFDDNNQELRIPLPARTGDIWHGYLPGGNRGSVMATGSVGHSPRNKVTVLILTSY